MDCTYLADSDGFALVSEREAAQLRVVGETFYANRLHCLDERNDLLASFRELWRLLRFAAGSLVEVVEKLLQKHIS